MSNDKALKELAKNHCLTLYYTIKKGIEDICNYIENDPGRINEQAKKFLGNLLTISSKNISKDQEKVELSKIIEMDPEAAWEFSKFVQGLFEVTDTIYKKFSGVKIPNYGRIFNDMVEDTSEILEKYGVPEISVYVPSRFLGYKTSFIVDRHGIVSSHDGKEVYVEKNILCIGEEREYGLTLDFLAIFHKNLGNSLADSVGSRVKEYCETSEFLKQYSNF